MLILLRQHTAAFCEAYSESGPVDAKVQSLADKVEGSLLQCATLEVLQQTQVDPLIDELHELLNKQ